jgi:hypothetical protein
MQQPIIEFTNFYEFESILNELKELTEKQGKIIEKQAKQIKKMKKSVKKNKEKAERTNCKVLQRLISLTEKTDCANSGVYQLIGGLYNQTKQNESIDIAISELHGKIYKKKSKNDPKHWGIWPTTRQGDKNEERIEELERKLEKISEMLS